MRCGYCGETFDESEGVRGCGGCSGGCHSVHCPRCGYKNPLEPGILKLIKNMVHKDKDKEKQ